MLGKDIKPGDIFVPIHNFIDKGADYRTRISKVRDLFFSTTQLSPNIWDISKDGLVKKVRLK